MFTSMLADPALVRAQVDYRRDVLRRSYGPLWRRRRVEAPTSAAAHRPEHAVTAVPSIAPLTVPEPRRSTLPEPERARAS